MLKISRIYDLFKQNKLLIAVAVLILIMIFSWISKDTINISPSINDLQEINIEAKITLPNSKVINIGIADTEEERTQGLAGVSNMLSSEGMWFVFEKESYYAFWMRGTLVNLDIIWLDKNMKIVDMRHNLEPAGEVAAPSTYKNTRPARYVLELLGGEAKSNRLKIGDQVEFRR
ncbi:MAG: DUF192 domain-containing protein [Patescibacteria group bacterium]|nr:DUF192 domain-containing protein [Patescibacteria group bacterium]